MVVRIEFDLMDVTFLRDDTESQIKEFQARIKKIENSKADYIDGLTLDLCKSRLIKLESIYNKCQKALIRKGWD